MNKRQVKKLQNKQKLFRGWWADSYKQAKKHKRNYKVCLVEMDRK